ncbi:hypothetical protein M427DRAFT_66001 [Gonapodya prolifera JEL478]|uniref:Cyclic nucleotide-binding domain-containing protein n=1 Tax=Gonapodya prolifera (strain JEL478) TaxID=1344416 RepID=A0A139AX17_GONPJ|nr:hypothetical protein M427DRAFT_66001 [Gonapodya prolifera JEL478]|eukprot:KXS21244.1 hypothetical protein M427DRAFT_66001 [Gonapodya prolifera JEL478]
MAENKSAGLLPSGPPAIQKSAVADFEYQSEKLNDLEAGTSEANGSTASIIELPLLDGILFWLTEMVTMYLLDPVVGSIRPIPLDHWILPIWAPLILLVHFINMAVIPLASITLALRPMIALPGWYIFREGDEAAEMYFVKMGLVEVTSKDGSKVFVQLGEGKFFGEIALLENSKRTASVRAASLTELCVLTKVDFDIIVTAHPGIREKMHKVVNERKEADRKRKEASAAQAAAAVAPSTSSSPRTLQGPNHMANESSSDDETNSSRDGTSASGGASYASTGTDRVESITPDMSFATARTAPSLGARTNGSLTQSFPENQMTSMNSGSVQLSSVGFNQSNNERNDDAGSSVSARSSLNRKMGEENEQQTEPGRYPQSTFDAVYARSPVLGGDPDVRPTPPRLTTSLQASPRPSYVPYQRSGTPNSQTPEPRLVSPVGLGENWKMPSVNRYVGLGVSTGVPMPTPSIPSIPIPTSGSPTSISPSPVYLPPFSRFTPGSVFPPPMTPAEGSNSSPNPIPPYLGSAQASYSSTSSSSVSSTVPTARDTVRSGRRYDR